MVVLVGQPRMHAFWKWSTYGCATAKDKISLIFKNMPVHAYSYTHTQEQFTNNILQMNPQIWFSSISVFRWWDSEEFCGHILYCKIRHWWKRLSTVCAWLCQRWSGNCDLCFHFQTLCCKCNSVVLVLEMEVRGCWGCDKLEDCLGGSCLCQGIVIWKSENMCCWCDVLLYNTFDARPCHFHSVLIKLGLVKIFLEYWGWEPSCVSCQLITYSQLQVSNLFFNTQSTW